MSEVKDYVLSLLCDQIENFCSEFGYKFSDNKLKFTKSINGFKCEIALIGSSFNWPNKVVNYKALATITSIKYRKWLKEKFPHIRYNSNGEIFCNQYEDNVENHNYLNKSYNFISQTRLEIQEDFKNYLAEMDAYFTKFSNWKSIKEFSNNDIVKFDAYVQLNEIESAIKF